MPLALAMAPICALFSAILIGVLTMGFSSALLLVALLFAAAVAGAVAARQGFDWDDIQKETGRRISDALPAILILLSIGALIGSWMYAGAIPLMVVLGIELISPKFMVLTAFLATATMSVVSGTSWGAAGTIGVALMGAGEAMGIPLAPLAGAVVSGAYFGDKLSPLSDMTNIAAIGAGAELYAHIRHMLFTSLPPAVIAAIVFAIIGMLGMGANGETLAAALAVKADLEAIYRLNAYAAAPLALAVIGIVCRFPPVLVIMASSLLALVVGAVVQGFPLDAAMSSFVAGFNTVEAGVSIQLGESIPNLLNRGGVFSMAPTLIFIFAAFLLAGAMEISGALDTLLRALLAMVRSTFGLVAASMSAGAMMVALTSHGGVTSLIVGGLFKKPYANRNLAPENLSRAIEDSVTVTEPLMPWTVSALFMAGTLGVATIDYLPWAIFCTLGPVFSLAFAASHQLTGKGLKVLES